MDIFRLRPNWRSAYLGSVAVAAAASYLVWPTMPRPEVERIALAAGWAAGSITYALLAWKAREAASPWRLFDALTAIALGEVAAYEAFWPGAGAVVTPAVLGMIVAAVAFRASLRARPRHEGLGASIGPGDPG